MLFDFTPGETSAVPFFLALAMRWAGYGLFVAGAIYLGHRVDDWRLPVLALGVVVLPGAWLELGHGTLREMRLDGDFERSYGEVSRSISIVGLLLRWGLISALLVFGARAVMQHRLSSESQ